jgi:DNA invertase Pin-like site-specific DNA recombinase
MRYIYCRVSTSEQNIEQQVNYLKERYDHDAVVSDIFTGITTDRPKFNELLAKLESGDTLIVFHVSRLGRKTSEVLETVEKLQRKQVAVFVDQLQGIDITLKLAKCFLPCCQGLPS